MTDRLIAAYGEIYFDAEFNDWLPNKDFTKAKKLWKLSNNDKSDKNYLGACNLIQKHLVATFDKSRMIDHIADTVADADEDGWTSVSAENIIYAKRQSIFSKYNDGTYKREDVDSISVRCIDFYQRDEDDDPDFSSFTASPYIGFVLMKSLDLKESYQDQRDLDTWQEENNFDLESCFELQISDNVSDGSYSSEGGTLGYLLNEEGEILQTFAHRLFTTLLFATEGIEVDGETQTFFENLANGNFEEIKSYVDSNNINVNLPLFGDLDITKPLSIVFTSAWFERDDFSKTYESLFSVEHVSNKKLLPGLKESIFYLAAHGANLQQKIGSDVSYLAISLDIDIEITDFLLSFGFNPARDSGILLTACELGDKALVEKFLKLGAQVNRKGDATSAIMYAAQGKNELTLSEGQQKENIEIIDMLLCEGAKINKVDKGGDTALTNAVRCNNELIALHLIGLGADINGSKAKNALIPMEIAIENKFQNIVDILSKEGASDVSSPLEGKKEIEIIVKLATYQMVCDGEADGGELEILQNLAKTMAGHINASASSFTSTFTIKMGGRPRSKTSTGSGDEEIISAEEIVNIANNTIAELNDQDDRETQDYLNELAHGIVEEDLRFHVLKMLVEMSAADGDFHKNEIQWLADLSRLWNLEDRLLNLMSMKGGEEWLWNKGKLIKS